MKILHLITGLSRGGAETMLARLVTHMDPARFASVVVSLTDESGLGPELREAGIPVLALGMKRGRPSASAILRLREIIRRERPQLLLTWLYHADLLGLLIAALSPGLPLVWNLRCSNMDLAEYSWPVRAVRHVLARAARRPAAIIVNSDAGKRHHAALGYMPRRWELIPNGFDTAQFRPDPGARDAWRTRLEIGAEEFLIGMVARVDPMKDHATFLTAASRIAARCPDARFVLAGRGTETLAVPRDLAGKLRAVGERSDIATLLPALDLLVLSSAFGEGFPNVLGEAMASGIPCIATDVGDAAAIIGDSGRIVSPRDPAALADAAIDWIGCDPSFRRAKGDAARQRILDHYAIAVVVEQYQRLYQSLAGQG